MRRLHHAMRRGGSVSASAASAAIVCDAPWQRARPLPAFRSAHFEHRDALGDENVGGKRRELVYLAPVEGAGIDPVDHAMRCADDSDLHCVQSG